MVSQDGGAPGWEQSLLSVIRGEVEQLKYLVEDESGDIGLPDMHAQVSRLCGLTDLIYNESFQFSGETRGEIERLAEQSMELMQTRVNRTPPSPERITEIEQEAAQALYEAIAFNLPYLAQGDTSKHAMALSKEAFSSLLKHTGSRPDFEMIERFVLVQDYRIMKLAGSAR